MCRMSRIETLDVHRGGDRRGRGDAASLIVDRQRGGAPLHWSVWTLQRPCRSVARAGNVRLLPLSSVDSHNYGTHGDLRTGDVVGDRGSAEIKNTSASRSADRS